MGLISLARRAAVASVFVASVAVGVGGAVQADPITAPGYYKTNYSDVIYRYENGALSALTYPQWESLGFPQPTNVHSEVVKYAWSPTLYAVTFFETQWLWKRLSFDEWERMGFQAWYIAGWIAGSVIGHYGTSPHELFIVGEDGVQHKLTYPEWEATGFQPVDFGRTDVGFVQFRGSPTIFYVVNLHTPNEDGVPISYQAWMELGFPTPELR